MFYMATAFNDDISAWDTTGVTTMAYMFMGAASFDQNLGWCMKESVNLNHAFEGTACVMPSCGVVQGGCNVAAEEEAANFVMTDSTIRTAVAAWLADRSGAEATYGHISTWNTGGVTNMENLFGIPHGEEFNDDISKWNTAKVTNMV